MNRLRFTSAALIVFLCFSLLPTVPSFAAPVPFIQKNFTEPIDAFSIRLPLESSSFQYQYLLSGTWSSWENYESDGDSGSGEESELLMVPLGTTAIRIDGVASKKDIHEIVVSKDPVRVRVASMTDIVPMTLSRREWGADETYLFETPRAETEAKTEVDASKGDNGIVTAAPGQPDRRISDCNAAVKNYGSEFKIKSTIAKAPNGRTYRWAPQYSSSVKLLVVHHSALVVSGDPRPAAERVRALYKYHAVNKGWGDIGYHFIVDEDGVVYEGRMGGAAVVGGHAYCNNIGTIGIVLLGNFEIESPSQRQAQGLQKLLKNLALQYGLSLDQSAQFHGKTFPSPIVGHGDLLSTLCPGYSLSSGLSQIVSNVRSGKLTGSVAFAAPRKDSSSSSSAGTMPVAAGKLAEGLSFVGRTSIAINPGGKQRISFGYTAGASGAYEGKKIAEVRLSSPKIQLLVDDGINWIPVTKGILLQSDLPAHETSNIQLIVVAPTDTGSFWMEIGGQRFDIKVEGRRARTGEYINQFGGDPARIVRPKPEPRETKIIPRIRPQSRAPTPALSAGRPDSSSAHSTSSGQAGGGETSRESSRRIRIRLSASVSPVLTFPQRGIVEGTNVPAGTALTLLSKNNECVAMKNGELFAANSILRFSSTNTGVINVNSIAGKNRSYKGTLECRVIVGVLTVINELPIEEYMAGLAEEPDSEPYEKQRAFAIAARTYAAYYMESENRKFPGLPYDGSDDPSEFQAYAGVEFTANNPRWQRAVASTAGSMLRFNGELIKPPYFSSDPGRTLSPLEAGWKNFPFADIFSSKQDPWCKGQVLRGHGVGMSGCGARGQALQGRSAEQILQYYYPGARI